MDGDWGYRVEAGEVLMGVKAFSSIAPVPADGVRLRDEGNEKRSAEQARAMMRLRRHRRKGSIVDE